MFSDTFKGGVDMASASMRYIYTKASGRLGVSNFSEEELTEAEKSSNIGSFKNTYVGGLYNEGNTCFINSVVQSLASLDSMASYTAQIGSSRPNFSSHLLQLIHDLNRIRKTHHNYSTNVLMANIGGQARWSRLDQEDAQEFFQQLLVALEKDWKAADAATKPLADAEPEKPGTENQPVQQVSPTESGESVDECEKESTEAINNESTGTITPTPPRLITPFDGEFAVRVGCLKCGDMEGIRSGVLSSVDMGLDSIQQEFSLEQLFANYCHMETIPEVECYRCTLLNYKEKLHEKIEEAPPALAEVFKTRIQEVEDALKEKVIDDKRYSQLKASTYKTLGDKTRQTMFARPLPKTLMIHINRSVFDMRTGFTRKNYAPIEFPGRLDMSQFVTDPQDEGNKNPAHPMKGTPETPEWYSLKATVIHYGSANFGHYVCFRKFNGLWWRISDDSVELTTEAQVLGAQGVFMLFYEKESEQNPVTTTATSVEIASVLDDTQDNVSSLSPPLTPAVEDDKVPELVNDEFAESSPAVE